MKATVKYGLILGVSLIIYSLFLNIMGLAAKWQYGLLNLVILGVVLFFGMKERREETEGYITYGKALVSGLLIAVIGSALAGVFTYLYYEVFAPGEFAEVLKEQLAAGREQQEAFGMTPEQIAEGEKRGAMFRTPIAFGITILVNTTFIGFIISLILSAFLKKIKKEKEILTEKFAAGEFDDKEGWGED